MGRRRHKTDVSRIRQGSDLTVFKHRATAAEDEIHRSFNAAVGKPLLHFTAPAERIQEETFIAADEIRRKRAAKQGILGGGQNAAFHGEAVAHHT